MTPPNVDSSRRNFLRAAAGTATVTAATGSATAAESGGGGGGGGGSPDWGGYLSSANNYGDSTEDLRGQSEVTISVGAGENGLAFDPAAAWVDTGTTVIWEWTGNGGNHNVVSDESDIDSGAAVGTEGETYEVTFEESAIHKYYCSPHQSSGMLGALAVGDDVPTVQPDTGGGGPTLPDNAKILGIASGFAMASTLGLAYLFMRYGGDYEGDL